MQSVFCLLSCSATSPTSLSSLSKTGHYERAGPSGGLLSFPAPLVSLCPVFRRFYRHCRDRYRRRLTRRIPDGKGVLTDSLKKSGRQLLSAYLVPAQASTLRTLRTRPIYSSNSSPSTASSHVPLPAPPLSDSPRLGPIILGNIRRRWTRVQSWDGSWSVEGLTAVVAAVLLVARSITSVCAECGSCRSCGSLVLPAVTRVRRVSCCRL